MYSRPRGLPGRRLARRIVNLLEIQLEHLLSRRASFVLVGAVRVASFGVPCGAIRAAIAWHLVWITYLNSLSVDGVQYVLAL